MANLTLRALSRALKVALKTVQEARDSGRITPERDGRWNLAKVRRQWAANTQHTKRPPRTSREAEGTLDVGNDQADGTVGGGLNKARMVSETLRARMLQLDYDQKRGKLVDADEVRKSAFAVARETRDILMALPPQLGPLVAGQTPQEATKLLEEELGRICDQLSRRNGNADR